MAPRYNLHSQKALLVTQDAPVTAMDSISIANNVPVAQDTPGNVPLPGTYVETPTPTLEVEPPKGSPNATTASSRRSSAKIVPGLLFSQVVSRSPSPVPLAREKCCQETLSFRTFILSYLFTSYLIKDTRGYHNQPTWISNPSTCHDVTITSLKSRSLEQPRPTTS